MFHFSLNIRSFFKILSKLSNKKFEFSTIAITKGTRFIFDETGFSFRRDGMPGSMFGLNNNERIFNPDESTNSSRNVELFYF